MCWYKRIIYSRCNHQFFVDLVLCCYVQMAYDAKQQPDPCYAMNSTPFQSYRVELECRACRVAKCRVDSKINKARMILQEAKKRLDASSARTVSSPVEEWVAATVEEEAEEEAAGVEEAEGAEEAFEPVDEKTVEMMARTQGPFRRMWGRPVHGVQLRPPWSDSAERHSDGPTGDGDGSESTSSLKSSDPATTPTTNSRESPLDAADAPAPQTSSWNDMASGSGWERWSDPGSWAPLVLTAMLAAGLPRFYRSYLRRIPDTAHIAPRFFRRRTVLGKVTSVGDGDNFHLFHTPGGRLAGWEWFFKVPTGRKELKGQTIPIRIAGIDAPECAHFGRPAQPHSDQALAFLRSYLLGRRVRAQLWRRDQYDRAVATVWVRRPPFFVPARDVGLEMLRRGLAAAYEAKTGAEYGGDEAEARYRAAEEEARRKGRGMWAPERGGFFGMKRKVAVESPRGFKERMRDMERTAGQGTVAVAGKGGDRGSGTAKRGTKTGPTRQPGGKG